MEFAAHHLEATLEAHKARPLKRAWRWAVAVVGAATGIGDGMAPLDLVIRRIPSGAEIMRTRADVGSPDFLLDQVRRDLQEKTVEEFLAEWGHA